MTVAEQVNDAGFHRLAVVPAPRVIAEAPQLASALVGYPNVLVVANDVELWSRFVLDYQTSAKLRAHDHPFDAWVEATLEPIAQHRRAFYAHAVYPAPVMPGSSESGFSYLPMQRIAVAAGLATSCKAQLVVHPVVGPWISLRALIGLEPSDSVEVPGDTASGALQCNGTCDAALGRVLAKPDATWRDWLELRANCARPDAKWRFSDEQILYHYTKDRSVIGTGAKLPAVTGSR
jgi:hypothetical protein